MLILASNAERAYTTSSATLDILQVSMKLDGLHCRFQMAFIAKVRAIVADK